ncbi:MAG TPA: hypothetical protein ENN69_00810 [Spirochaetia bacterium]|nr:hypothetical protein [Spirochaetia bacterium]
MNDMTQTRILFLDHHSDLHKRVVEVDWRLENPYHISMQTAAAGGPPDAESVGRYLDPAVIADFCGRCDDHYHGRMGRAVVVVFNGAEMTPAPYCSRLVRGVKDKGCRIALTIRMARRRVFWERVAEYIDFVTLAVPETAAGLDGLLKLADYLGRSVTLRLDVNVRPDNVEQAKYAGETIMRSLPDAVVRFVPEMSALPDAEAERFFRRFEELQTRAYTHNEANDAHKRWYRGALIGYGADGAAAVLTPEELLAMNANRFKSWLCWSGVERLFVAPDGDVYRAGCGNERLGTVGGTVVFPSVPVSCPHAVCRDVRDIPVKRQRAVTFRIEQIPELTAMGAFSHIAENKMSL